MPIALASVPGIEWEIERESGDRATFEGVFSGDVPRSRHRPTNMTWEAAYKLAAPYLGKAHCISGHPRLEDSQIAAWLGHDKEGPEIVAARIEYNTTYSQAVEFLRPSAVTVTATTKAAKLCGERREYLKPLFEAPESRPFRFIDILGRPISWTLLDPKMPATGSPPQKEASEKPGAEYRQSLRPKIFEKLTDIIWDDQRAPHFASRPVNATWAEVQRRAAELMGREDCLAGRERLTTEGVYDAVGMTHEDRAKTDGAAVAYGKAYSAEVARIRDDDLNPNMEIKQHATAVLRDREPGPAGTIEIEAKRDSLEALTKGSEFRTKRAWSCLPPIPGLVWDHAKDSYEVRPVNMTWGEVHRLAADILGEDDAKAGKERMSKEMIYDALNLTDEDRAKTDVAHISYQKAYSGAVPYLRPGRVSDKAAGAAKKRFAWPYRERGSDDPLASVMYIDGHGLPIAWRLLDPDMEVVVDDSVDLPAAVPRQLLNIPGGSQALAMLMQIFADGPMYSPPKTERGCHEILGQDGLIVDRDDLGLAITEAGKKALADNLKSILAALSPPSR
mgnify:FL=1